MKSPVILIFLFLIISSANSQTFHTVGGKSIFDLQSHGSPQQVYTDPNNPNNIHVVYTTQPYNDTSLNSRRTSFFFSSDSGNTWSFPIQVPIFQSSFATVSVLSDGNTIISNHSSSPGNQRSVAYVDVFPGLGSFTALDPGSSKTILWPKLIPTSNISNVNKFILIGVPSGGNSILIGKSLSSTNYDFSASNFSPGNGAESYAIAKGKDGRIGIVYVGGSSDRGDVFFMESTNNGQSFNRIKIFNSIEYGNGDFLGAYKGISIAYLSNTPKVVFETIRQNSIGGYYPNISSQIRFWSLNLYGNDPDKCIVIADSTNIPFHPILTFDNEAPLCRPVIGTSTNNQYVTVAFIAASSQNLNGRSYKDIYLMRSYGGGSTWSPSIERINPISPRLDYNYVSMSPVNPTSGFMNYVDLVFQRDTVPGSFVNGAARSLAENIHYRHIYGIIVKPTLPYTPALLSPYNNSLDVNPFPVLDWDETFAAATYELQVSADSNFSNPVINLQNLTGTSYQTTSSLNLFVKYYWRVRGRNFEGEGSWSYPWCFIMTATNIIPETEIAYEYKLFNNYPNPFNPETNIKFSIPKSDIVTLSIYDVRGTLVGQLINNQKLNSGVYNYKFNASNLTSGIYFYIITTSAFTETKKMLLVK